MVQKIDHIGIAVLDIEAQMKFYQDILGLTCSGVEEIPDQNVKIAIFPVGEVQIELLQSTSEDSHIAKFLQKRGEGIHHIAYQVSDLTSNLKKLDQIQIQLIDSKPRHGARGHKIAFLHPKSTFGVLIEMCEY